MKGEKSKSRIKIKIKVKSVGQECPTHTGNFKVKGNGPSALDSRGRLSPHELRRLSADEDDFGMEQGSGYAGGDGEELPLSIKDFDLAGAGEFGEIDGASVADSGDGGFVGRD